MNDSIADNLASTVAASGSIELPADILEFSIDQVLDEGILKDIPFVGWIVKGISAAKSISDRIFFHKILRFIFALDGVESSVRADCQAMLRVDSGYSRRGGEHLVLILDKIDSLQKADMLAKCFSHFLAGDLDHNQFMDLSHVIDRSSLSDLEAIAVPDNRRIAFRSTSIAASSGILEYGITDAWSEEQKPELGTRLSSMGTDLRDIFLGRFKQRIQDQRDRRRKMEELIGCINKGTLPGSGRKSEG